LLVHCDDGIRAFVRTKTKPITRIKVPRPRAVEG
jgi:hypothetical protein